MSEDKKADVPMPRLGGYLGTVLKSALSVCGATAWLVPILDDTVRRSTERALRRAVRELDTMVEELGERIERTPERIDQDALADAIKSFLRQSQQTSRQEKLRAAARLMANALLKDGDRDKLSYTEHDFFSRCIDGLSMGSVKVLAGAVRVVDKLRPTMSTAGELEFTTKDLIPAVEDLSPDIVLSSVSELSVWNLLRVQNDAFITDNAYQDKVGYRSNTKVFLTRMGKQVAECLRDVAAS